MRKLLDWPTEIALHALIWIVTIGVWVWMSFLPEDEL